MLTYVRRVPFWSSSLPMPSATCIAAEIECEAIRIRLFNGADNSVIQNTLKCIGCQHDGLFAA